MTSLTPAESSTTLASKAPASATPSTTPKPLLLYVHIPFCLSKCHFCDWVTEIPVADLRQRPGDPRRIAYIEALCRQIQEHGKLAQKLHLRPEILYWGGGTATILTEAEIDAVASALHEAFDTSALREATIEGSPDTLTMDKLQQLQRVGFTRISLGIQSLSDRRLRALGRTHDSAGAMAAVEQAHRSGFQDISVDLMSGMPGEEEQEFMTSLERVLTLPVNHVALYPYRAAAGTSLVRQLRVGHGGKIRLDVQQSTYKNGAARLIDAGFEEYAASHFGSPPCHSDMAYFKLEMDWLGCGSGATSLLDGEFLSFKRGYLDEYLADPTAFDERVPAKTAGVAARLVYQALTTKEGVVRSLFEDRLKAPLADVLKSPAVRGLLDAVRSIAALEEDSDGIRLPAQEIARAFIHLLFINAPTMGREQPKPGGVFGCH
jgi:oxygen-independent coproporphyrinogen-3 oxidase